MKKKDWIKPINFIFGILIPIIFFLGGIFFYSDINSWKEIFGVISKVLYFLPLVLIAIGILSTYYFRAYVRLLISVISLLGLFVLALGLVIVKNQQLLLDNEDYISTQVVDIIKSLPTQTPLATITPQIVDELKIAPTSALDYDKKIVSFIETVNNKIVKGLLDTKNNKDAVLEYFCSSSPKAKDQINTFFSEIIRKYRGYNVKDISLPAKFVVEKVIQEPTEINKGRYFYSQIETWYYTQYPGEKNERIDPATNLFKYSVDEIQEGVFCISNYEYEKPPEDYYLELENENR